VAYDRVRLVAVEITVKVDSDVAPALRAREASPAAGAAEIRAAIEAEGAMLEPLHPGEADPELGSYFRVTAPDATAERLLSTLRSHAAIEGAYVKPADEAP
jgi:hypothetical protein